MYESKQPYFYGTGTEQDYAKAIAFYQQGVGSSDTSGTSAKLEKMTVGNLWTEFYIPVQTGSVDPSRASIFFACRKPFFRPHFPRPHL